MATNAIPQPNPDELRCFIALGDLELKIQKMLLDFVNEHGCKIDRVEIDTRNFSNLAVEIHLKESNRG
jgi:hypothetical protein